MKILFTGGGGAGNESIWRHLSHKYDLYFADACIEAIAETIPKNKQFQIPFASDKDFIPSLQEICSDSKIDVLVPGVDEELCLLCENRHINFPEIMLPSSSFVKLMLDKYSCALKIQSTGLTAPRTTAVEYAENIGFPCIIKPKSGRGSRGVSILSSKEEIAAYKILNKTANKELLAQELGIGREFTICVIANIFSELIGIIPVEVEEKKGITIRAHIEPNTYLIEYIKQFHEKFMPSGIYNLQCILTKDNVVLPFEINPRISTTFCLALATGFDPFKEYFQKKSKELFSPPEKIYLKRNWVNHIYQI